MKIKPNEAQLNQLSSSLTPKKYHDNSKARISPSILLDNFLTKIKEEEKKPPRNSISAI